MKIVSVNVSVAEAQAFTISTVYTTSETTSVTQALIRAEVVIV